MKLVVDRKVGDFPLRDKVVVVTGGGSGISFAFSQLALEAGAKVILADLRLTSEAEASVNNATNSHNMVFVKTDVTDWTQLENLVTTSKKTFGSSPDVFVAGAGVFEPPSSSFWSDSESNGSYLTLDINAGHVIKLARIALRSLVREDKKGVFVSIASMAGLRSNYSSPLYCASKFAVVGLTRSLTLADPLEGVKFCTICPGLVKTPLLTQEKLQDLRLGEQSPILKSDEVASAMMSLAQDGRYGGGTVMTINPGPGGAAIELEAETPSLMNSVEVGNDLHPLFEVPKEVMDRERGTSL